MPEITYWGRFRNVQYHYCEEDDVVVVCPVDDDDNAQEDFGIAFEACCMEQHLKWLQEALDECKKWRRVYRAARKRGIPLEVVKRRHEGAWLADEADELVREMQRSNA